MSSKPICRYGDQCYRKNPIHFQEFDHPFDWKSRVSTADDKSLASTPDKQSTSSATNQSSSSADKESTTSEANRHKKLKNSDCNDSNVNQTIDSNIIGFYLTKVKGIDKKYNQLNSKAIDLKDILSETNGHLLESVQFNFMFEIDWLLDQYPLKFRSLPLLIVYGSKRDGLATKQMQYQTEPYPNVRLFGAQLFEMFGTHHTKMMLLRYDNGIRVVVHTANLIKNDWTHKTQGVWMSPLFPSLNTTHNSCADVSQTRFKTDLIDYLNCYNSKEIEYWIQIIRRHDLSSAKVFFIGSTPGRHLGEEKWRFGHMKLRKLLSEFGPSSRTVDPSWPVIGQFSSIGSLGNSADKWLTSEFLASLSTDCGNKFNLIKAHLKLIFPSVEDVRNSLEGYCGGGSLPYSSNTHSKQTYLTSFLHSWRSDQRGRTNACPHIKTYSRLSPDYKRMAYFVLTSANLSKAAWGQLEKNGSQLAIKSFEAGVLFIPKLFSNQEFFDVSKTEDLNDFSNTSSFPIPYDIPLQRYSPEDNPWMWDIPHTDKPDRLGNAWIPE